ncbi:MAG: LysR family transcriptional regulator [Coriobacteriales bacterium]|jgi:DNA-binding transcriptional LysR family regulator|nr:LysR family transcriptional regulator [Coriobacteriales bacterium]
MRIEYLREFLILSEADNFAVAADRLFVSVSSISRHLAVLEAELGLQLLDRSARQIRLTEQGIVCRQSFEQIVAIADSLLEYSKSVQGKISGTLKISVPYYSYDVRFADMLSRFESEYPDVSIKIATSQPQGLYDDLLQHRVDLGFLPGPFTGDEAIIFVPMYRSKYIALLSTEHRLAGRPCLSLSDLVDELLVELEDESFSNAVTRNSLARCNFAFKRTAMTHNIESVPGAIRKNNGVHISGLDVSKQASLGISYIPIADENFYYEYSIAYHAGNTNPLVPVIMEFLTHYQQR